MSGTFFKRPLLAQRSATKGMSRIASNRCDVFMSPGNSYKETLE